MSEVLSPVRPALGKRTFPRARVLPHAEALRDLLAPHCDLAALAGSLRREKPFVGDVEIVIRLGEPGLFGDGRDLAAVSSCLERLVKSSDLAWDQVVRRDGPRYKRLLIPALDDLPLDLFFCNGANFGNIHAIRTGDAEFSRFVMTRGWWQLRRQWDGYLWQCLPGDARDGEIPPGRKIIPCPTEEAYFAAIGVPFVPPARRNAAMVARLRKEAARV